MKKRLLIILGSGSSIGCGMPSVAAIDGLMSSWARDVATQTGTPDYFALAWSALAQHLSEGLGGARARPDFERALGELMGLMHWVRPSPMGSALRRLVAAGAMPSALDFPQRGAYGPTIGIKTLICVLMENLARHMRHHSLALDITAGPMRTWKRLLESLRERFDVVVYTLNYDAVALTAWPEALTGFDSHGVFRPEVVHRRAWEGLFHLHGNVHFSLRSNLGEELIWQSDLNSTFFDSDDARSSDPRSDGRDFPRTTLIAGGFKLDQLLVEPFNTYQASLIRDAYNADAILLGGYGFTDVHVNRALRNALMKRNALRPPALVLDWVGDPKTNSIAFRDDRWAYEAMHALYAPTNKYAMPGHDVPTPVPELKASMTCEVSNVHRTAFWYGGYLEAHHVTDRMAGWLDGGADQWLALA